MSNITNNRKLRAQQSAQKSTNSEPEKIQTTTFVDTWKIDKVSEAIESPGISFIPIQSPTFAHDFLGQTVRYKTRFYCAKSGLLTIDTQFERVDNATIAVQCFLRNASGGEIRMSNSLRDGLRFKHVVQRSTLTNGWVSNDALIVALKISLTTSGDHEGARLVKLADDLANLLESGSHSDVTLVVDKCTIRAHKAILACRSSVFASIFREEHSDTLEIKSFSVDAINELLRFCYSGRVARVSRELLRVSDQFDVVGLKILCEDSLARALRVDNAAVTLALAEHCRAATLRLKTVQFIGEHLKQVVETPKFQSLSKTSILDVLRGWSAMDIS